MPRRTFALSKSTRARLGVLPTKYGPMRKYRKQRSKFGKKGKKYQPTRSFQKQMKLYENQHVEKKFIPMRNRTNGPGAAGYEFDCPAVAIPNAGLTGADDGLSGVILQTGETLTNANAAMNTTLGEDLCYEMAGYTVTRGTGAVSDIVGNYVNLSSSFINININVDPYQSNNQANADLLAASLPRQFRLIMVKGKRNNSVAGGASTDQGSLTGAIQTNLFIDEINQEKGLLDPMSVQDAFTWLINKQKFQVLKDERFTLYPNQQYTKTDAVNTASGPNGIAKSQRFKKYYLPVPKNKIKYDTEHTRIQPLDFNYVVHTVILCKSMGGSGNPSSLGWNVQCNGQTSYTDF